MWSVATAYVLLMAFVMVFPTYVPFGAANFSTLVGLTVVFVVLGVTRARTAARPLAFLVALPLFALAAFDLSIGGCPGVGCATPPGYEPWRNVKFFLKWTFTGPALGMSSEPNPCASLCPHRIELVPLFAGYVALWWGYGDGASE